MKNFFSLLLALMFSCTFTVCAFAAEPYAENSNPPTLQDTLQEILDNPTYSNAYKEAAKKKCDYLMSVRDSGPSALTRASNSMTIYVPHTRQPNGVSCGPSTVRQTLAHYGLVKNLSTIMSEMMLVNRPPIVTVQPMASLRFRRCFTILILACMEKAVTLQGLFIWLCGKMVHIHLPNKC